MLKILNYFTNHRFLAGVICIFLGLYLGFTLANQNFTNIKSLLNWCLGLGVFGILLLHSRAYFGIENISPYYTRFYGLFFGLVISSSIFILFTFVGGQQNIFFNQLACSCMIGLSLYNFISNNHLGLEKKHSIAEILVEKKLKKSTKESTKEDK
jgi:hypothetical protein